MHTSRRAPRDRSIRLPIIPVIVLSVAWVQQNPFLTAVSFNSARADARGKTASPRELPRDGDGSALAPPAGARPVRERTVGLWSGDVEWLKISFEGGGEIPTGGDGVPDLCDSYHVEFIVSKKSLKYEECSGKMKSVKRTIILERAQDETFRSALGKLALLQNPRCATTGDAGIIQVDVKKFFSPVKSYVDDVSCGYENRKSGVIAYDTILRIVGLAKALSHR